MQVRSVGRPRGVSAARHALALVALLLVLGCGATRVAPYEEHVEAAVVELQPALDRFLTEAALDPGSASYAHAAGFYTGCALRLRTTLMWARSHPHNDETVEQLELMLENLESLRAAHESGPLDPAACRVFRDMFNTGWTAILTLELAKKRGD